MRKKLMFGLGWMTTACGLYAQSTGLFSALFRWQPVPGASGYTLSFGYASSAPGTYFTNFNVTSGSTTSFTFLGQPGVGYRSTIQAFASDGRRTAPVPDVVWTNPPLLTPVQGYNPVAVMYVLP